MRMRDGGGLLPNHRATRLKRILHDRPVFREPRIDVAGPIVAQVFEIPLLEVPHRAAGERAQQPRPGNSIDQSN